MMDEPIGGFRLLQYYYAMLDDWADCLPSMGWRAEIEDFDDSIPEALFVMLPAIWRLRRLSGSSRQAGSVPI